MKYAFVKAQLQGYPLSMSCATLGVAVSGYHACPGDLVFDPTCGSGTTAVVAEQWGRRWITCDTSRVLDHVGEAAHHEFGL